MDGGVDGGEGGVDCAGPRVWSSICASSRVIAVSESVFGLGAILD